jgi:hypothetical protein
MTLATMLIVWVGAVPLAVLALTGIGGRTHERVPVGLQAGRDPHGCVPLLGSLGTRTRRQRGACTALTP